MLIPLIVTLTLTVQVCSAALYDPFFTRLTNNQATQASQFLSTAIFSNGDVLVGGFTFGVTGSTTIGSRDFLLQRYSVAGALIWTKVFGGVGQDSIEAVTVDSSDNIYATGYTSPLSTGSYYTGNEVYIAKFDSSGNTIFSTQVGGSSEDTGAAICVDSTRGVFYVAGYTKSPTFYDVASSAGGGKADAFLLQLNSATGAVIKNSQQGVSGYASFFFGLALDSTGAVWATGRTDAPTYFTKTSMGSNDMIVQKFSTTGVSLVANLLGGNNLDQATGIVCDADDNVYVTGWAPAAVDGQTFQGDVDILLSKFNSAGTKLWTKLLGSSGFDGASSMAIDSALGRVYISGCVGTATFYGTANTGTTPFLLVASTADGSYVSSKLYSATGNDNSANAIAVRGPMIYLAGNTINNYQGQTNSGGAGVNAGFVMKIGDGIMPAASPSAAPTIATTAAPSTSVPTPPPSLAPVVSPTAQPNPLPSVAPVVSPTAKPTPLPSVAPVVSPTAKPTTSAPSLRPTVTPTTLPTASPTRTCVQWTLGDYGESCSATCGKLSRTCKDKYLKDVVTQEAFYAVVGSAVNVRSGGAVGSAETFCSLTTESVVTVGTPAALSIVLSSEDHHSPVRTSCSYPASAAEVTVGCDDVLPLHNYRRFCPCVDHNCDGAWYLGYSGDSCDATCTSAGGVCDAEPLSSIVNADAFSAMVASATVVETNELIGESSAAFCHEGINTLPLAPAPAVITLTFGAVNETLCAYPTDVSSLQGSCAMAFTDLPVQRFCNCKVLGSALSGHRMLLGDATTAQSAAVPALGATGAATPRLRGNKAAAPLEV